MKNMMNIVFIAMTLVLVGCVNSEPKPAELSDSDVIMDRLHRVTNADASLAYADPNADFSKYGQVMIDPLGVSDIEIIKPNTRSSVNSRAGRSNWELTDADKLSLQKAFADAMTVQLQEKGDYPIVTETAPDVLRISAVLTALAPSAPPENHMTRGRVYTEGSGSVYISVGFVDSESGEILAIVKDVKSSNNQWGINNRVTNMSDVKFMFIGWARAIRARLDIVRGD
ncbi:MAG: DUF3313 domain-containing protein [Oceanicoccus sp.]